MITEEQIKKLKPGDPLTIHGTFERIATDGDICIKVPMSLHGVVDNNNVTWAYPSAVAVTKRRYDPCRLFKKGDIVRLTEWNGRCPALPEDWKFDNGLFKVHEDEKFNSSVEITRENSTAVYIAPICFIELITPVEELQPYSVQDTMNHDGWQIVRDGLPLALYDVQRHPDAKAAAEAECKRLNTEWRKEHENEHNPN